MITRRHLILALATGALTSPFDSFAQAQEVRRIGFLYSGSRQSAIETGRYPAFIEGMRNLGYIEGKNLQIEARFSGAQNELPALGEEILRSKPELVVTAGAPPARAIVASDRSMPVVIVVAFDPVRDGFAQSLSKPGGNVTGLSSMLDDIFAKHVELLKLAVPKLSRIAALALPRDADHLATLEKIESTARPNGVRVIRVDVDARTGFEPAFRTIGQERAGAVIILGSAYFVQHFREIAALALKNNVASVYSGQEYPNAGGLMSYGPDFIDNYRRAATFVDKILKGAKPADLPFEQPTRIYLTLNRKTANALGLPFSQELLLRADKVIE